jgi:hypothetical protein
MELSVAEAFGHFAELNIDVGSVLVRRARKCHISGRWQSDAVDRRREG